MQVHRTQEQQDRFRRLWWKVVLLALGMLGGVFGSYRYSLHRRVQDELKQIEAAGYPTTLAGMEAWNPDLLVGQNAAELYQQAFDALSDVVAWQHRLPGSRAVGWPPLGQSLLQPTLKDVERYLSLNDEALRLLHEAGRLESARYPVSLAQLKPGHHPAHWGQIQHAARCLQMEGMVHAEYQQPELAARSIVAIIKISQSLRNEPFLRSHKIRRFISEGLGFHTLEYMINYLNFNEPQLNKLKTAFDQAQISNALAKVIAGERCAAIELLYRHRKIGGTVTQGGSSQSRVYKVTGRHDREFLVYLRFADRLVRLCEKPVGGRLSELQNLKAQLVEGGKYSRIRNLLMKSLLEAATSDLQSITSMQISSAVIAIKQYQLGNARLPDRLEDLVPDYLAAVPIDPLDGQPLRLKKTAAGCVVYSVGLDGIDNGGAVQDDNGRRFVDGTDIMFTINHLLPKED